MKKTMKKYLSLLLAVLMVVTSFSFAVSAAGNCNHQINTNDPKFRKVVNPTCDEMGYTIFYCVNCGEEISRNNDIQPALGHKYLKSYYASFDDGKSYRKVDECTREYTQDGVKVKCGSTNIETDDGKEVVYYRVDFKNNKVTGENGYFTDITYTDVVDTDKLVTVDLGSIYVREGEEAIYPESEFGKPIREKTKLFARYRYVGWTTDSNLEASIENPLGIDDCLDLVITENTTLYPVFEGLTGDAQGTITHRVIFYVVNPDGTLTQTTNPQYVEHADTVKYSKPDGQLYDAPEKDADLVNTYEFAGWDIDKTYKDGDILIKYNDIEKTPIYGNVNFYAAFNAVPKNYTLMFFDGTGENLIKYTDADGNKKDAVFSGINLRTNLLNPAVYGPDIGLLNNDANALKKAPDDDYIYTWTGEWAILKPDGTTSSTVNLSNFNIGFSSDYAVAYDSEGNEIYENGEQKKIIKLIPIYKRTKQLYAVNIEMLIPQGEDQDYYRGGADVHVTSSNGQLMASGTTDANGMFRCYLYNQTPFTVTIATSDDKYIGTGTITSLEKAYDGTQSDEANRNLCRVQMTLNPEYETHCTCIHHNALLQPIWVRILNILYNLFNIRYACCYDMYSTIGPLLDYTQA